MSGQLKEILKRLESFVAPVNSSLVPEESPAEWLNNILKEKLKGSPSSGNDDLRWSYVKEGMGLLKDLKEALVEVKKEEVTGGLAPDTLSVSQQQNVSSLLQLIVAMGIVPSLLPGVGLPMEKRSKFYDCLKIEWPDEPPIEEKYNRLVYMTNHLLDLNKHTGLSHIIVTRHLGDLMASLIQLSYAPLKKPSTEKTQDFLMTQEKYDQLQLDQAHFSLQLDKLIDKVYQPLVVKYLLVLQSCGASQVTKPVSKSINVKRTKTPKWLQSSCGTLLSGRLTSSKRGVLNVIQGILDVGQGDSGPADAQKYQVIASVVSSPPSTGSYSDLESYFKLVCPQLLSMLDMEDSTENKVYHMVACNCIRTMTERSLILSRRHLLGPLMEPLSRLLVKSEEKKVIVEEKEMEMCVKKLHLCFVLGNDPSLVFIGHLQPVILVLLELHCQITFGVSHIKMLVQQLLNRFFRCSSHIFSTIILRAFSFNETNEKENLKPMCPDYTFISGEEGGVEAVIRPPVEEEGQQSFYVADDEKSIALVDLLQESNEQNLRVEFYFGLLKDLTDMMSGLPETVSLEEAKMDTCNQLLQLEADLDKTMATLRKRLMVIRLIGLLSEDEKLQENLLKNSQRLIHFLSLTFGRAAALCKLRNTMKKEDLEEYSGGMMELQSLKTSLSLLVHVVTQPNAKVTDVQLLLKGTVCGDLETLEQMHTDDSVKQLSGRLHRLISAHGNAVKHQNEMKEKAQKILDKTSDVQQRIEDLKLLAKNEQEKENVETFQDAIALISSEEEVPIRGHGLIALTRLVENKDEETLKNMEKVLEMFKENLSDKDTYVYLQAIMGLATCAAYYPDAVIDKLSEEFARLNDDVEMKTKVGEAMVRVTKLMGEMATKHKNKLLNPLLGQVNHPDPLVRASSLSNLGEVCKNLRFSVGDIIQEIFSCLHHVVQFDKALEPRRAGVLVITLLLQGLGRDSFRVLQSVLRDIWRALIALRNSETDDVMQVHVGQAIDEIDKIVKDFMQPGDGMSKTIYVLDKPPEPF